MPAMLCRCGEVLSWSDIPNPIEWLLISDVDFDKYGATIDRDTLYRSMKSLLRCPRCGRLWIFWDGWDAPPKEYLPGPPLADANSPEG